MQITQIWIYPIKSCAGVGLSEGVLGERGLQHDRQWMVVDQAGKLVTQREVPRLVWVRPQVTDTELIVNAPEMPELRLKRSETGESKRVSVWNDVMDAVNFPEAREWFRHYTKKDVDLVYLPDSSPRPMNPKFGTRQLTFVDGNPLHIISESSVAELNQRLATPIELSRFRANLVFSGAEPYAEDAWTKIKIGDIPFSVYEACQRCVMLNVDPASAVTGKEPLATLARYRRQGQHVLFGQNINHLGGGVVKVGALLHDESERSLQ
jgi:uncharacterized protein